MAQRTNRQRVVLLLDGLEEPTDHHHSHTMGSRQDQSLQPVEHLTLGMANLETFAEAESRLPVKSGRAHVKN